MSRVGGEGERQVVRARIMLLGPVGVAMSMRRVRTCGEWGREVMRVARAEARGVLEGERWWIIIWRVGCERGVRKAGVYLE